MDIKQFVRDTWEDFLLIFFFTVLGVFIYLRILGYDAVPMRDIVGIIVVSLLTSLAGFILYSNKEPKRVELLVRHIIHLLAIIGIGLSVATYMRWVAWDMPNTVIRATMLIIGIYIAVISIIFYRTKKLMDRMNVKLKERQKR